MRIVVCVKQVPATCAVRLDPSTNTIRREQAEMILNPFDLFAVEEAVRLKARLGGSVHVLSMGIPAAAAILQEAIAMGADSGSLLSDRRFAGADTIATGYTLMHGVQKNAPFDLILCGQMATDGDTAQVPPILAEYLGVSCLTDVSEILSCKDGILQCRRMGDDGYSVWNAPLPALITITKECNVPRLPSIAGLRYARSQQIPVLSADDFPQLDLSRIGLHGSATQVKRTFVPQTAVETQMLFGSAAEQAHSLIQNLIDDHIFS